MFPELFRTKLVASSWIGAIILAVALTHSSPALAQCVFEDFEKADIPPNTNYRVFVPALAAVDATSIIDGLLEFRQSYFTPLRLGPGLLEPGVTFAHTSANALWWVGAGWAKWDSTATPVPSRSFGTQSGGLSIMDFSEPVDSFSFTLYNFYDQFNVVELWLYASDDETLLEHIQVNIPHGGRFVYNGPVPVGLVWFTGPNRSMDDLEFCPGGLPTNQPPTASFSFLPNPAFIGDTVLFDASASADPDGAIVRYRWDFGDGTVIDGDQAAVHVSHTFLSQGNWPVTLRVQDDDGADHDTQLIVGVLPRPQDRCEPVDSVTVAVDSRRRPAGVLGQVSSSVLLADGSVLADLDAVNLSRLWLQIAPLAVFQVSEVEPRNDGAGFFAALGFLPPCEAGFSRGAGFACAEPGAAGWQARFCGPGSVGVRLELSSWAVFVTLIDRVLGDALLLSPTKIAAVALRIRGEIPALDGMAQCLTGGIGRGAAARCAWRGLTSLLADPSQLTRLLTLLTEEGVTVTFNSLVQYLGSIGVHDLQILVDSLFIFNLERNSVELEFSTQ